MPTRISSVSNPYYPLPRDYPALDARGQKLARLNALMLQQTPTDVVHAWSFFRSYYLRDDPKSNFRCGWYKRFRESPPVHYRLIHDMARYPYNCCAMPRSFAKSTVYKELALLLFLTRQYFKTLLVYSRTSLITDRFSNEFMYQLENNARILDDFGTIKPKIGGGTWNSHMLVNAQTRAILYGMAVKGVLLGQRPDQILGDDVEHDPELQIASSDLIENFDRFMHNVVLPMQDEGGTATALIGSLFNNRCFLARWIHMDPSEDPRVSFWNRVLYSAEDRNPDGTLLWEAKFSQEVLDRDKIRLGLSAYAAQRLNKPGVTAIGVLPIDLHYGQYWIEDMDPIYTDRSNCPLSSASSILTYSKSDSDTPDRVVRKTSDVFSRMTRYLFLDYAQCQTATSDFVNILVLGVENSGTIRDRWYVLDNIMLRIRGDALFRLVFQTGFRWRVRYLCIEAVAAQQVLLTSAEAHARMWESRGWKPVLCPVDYPHGMSKEERILGLEWRFHRNMVLLPAHFRHRQGIRELYDQIESFTGEKGCLRYDDGIDTLAMPQFVLRQPRGGAIDLADGSEPDELDVPALLSEGTTHTDSGIWVGGVSPQVLDMTTVRSLMAARYNPQRGDNLTWIPLKRT